MSSQFGFKPHARPTPANNVYGAYDSNVLYAAPVHLLSATTETTAGDVTYTANEILGGFILRDPSGSTQTDTFPTAAQLVAAFNGCTVGSAIRVVIRNFGGEQVTMAAGTGFTFDNTNTKTIAAADTAEYLILFTNVTPGSEAGTIYTITSANTH